MKEEEIIHMNELKKIFLIFKYKPFNSIFLYFYVMIYL